LQSWISNGQFFVFGPPSQPAFYGTQLVLISRQFSVILETVNEVRFALDSVFIGPSERQTLLLNFSDGSPSMFLEVRGPQRDLRSGDLRRGNSQPPPGAV